MKLNLTNILILAFTLSGGIFPTLAQASCSNDNTTVFGINCDGWHVNVDNKSNSDMIFAKTSSKGVYSSPEKISALTTDVGNTLGKESWTGGPADMRIYYTGDDLPRGGRFIYVTASRKGETTVTCGTWKYYGVYQDIRYIYEYPGTACSVTEPPTGEVQSNQPIEVVFTTTGTTISPF